MLVHFSQQAPSALASETSSFHSNIPQSHINIDIPAQDIIFECVDFIRFEIEDTGIGMSDETM